MAAPGGPAHVSTPVVAASGCLPDGVRLVRADNPGPMTLDGTNTWLVEGPDGLLVIDPGPADEGHLARIAAAGPVAAILATHAHPDHVDGLPRLVELTGAPVVPEAPGLTRLPVPGHTADSVCYLGEFGGTRVAFTGDTILGRGTTVVAYPDGDLGDYLASLERLVALDGGPAGAGFRRAGAAGGTPAAVGEPVRAVSGGWMVLPGHGPALGDLGAAAAFYLAHRRARLEQVRAVRAAGAGTAEQIVSIVYADVDPALWPAARWSVRAQLAYLDAVDGPATRTFRAGPDAPGGRS